MRRLLSFAFLMLALARPGLAAPAKLSLWHAYRGQEREALDALVAEYNAAHPEVQVEALAVPYDAFRNKLEAAAPRGNGPDLFIAAHERVGQWVNDGLLAPIEGDTASWHPRTVEALSWKGRIYGYPLSYKCLALFYNRALLPTPPATTEALVADLERLKGDGRFGLAYEATTPFHHMAWLFGFGGGIFQGDAVALDQPGNAESLAFVADLLKRGLIPDEATSALVTSLFNDGRAAMVINGPWFLGEIAPSIDYAIAPMPVISATGKAASPFLTVEGAMISAYAAHPAEAAVFGAWLAGPESARARALGARQSVAELSVYDDPAVANDPVIAAFRAQLDHTVPMPNRPEMSATWEPMARAIRAALRGDGSPEQAVKQAQNEYRIVSRPPPEATDPRPFWVVVGLAALGALGWVAMSAWRARAEIRRWSFAYAYVAPAAIGMVVLVLMPFVVGAGVSFFELHEGGFRFVGLANFKSIILASDWGVFEPRSFYFTLAVTMLWTAANVAAHVAIGMGLALLLREPWLKLRGLYRVLLIVPWAVPNYITALIWKGMFNRQFGAINGLLGVFGVEPISWFTKFSTSFAANLTTNTWLGFPFMMVVTLGALQSIPRELEQAAEIDGANGWQRFRHITLPLLAPALLPAVVLGSVWTFNMFNIIYLVSAGEPDGSTEILISEAYKWAFTRGNRYGYAAAYSVLIFFTLVLYTRGTNKLLARRGL